MEWEGGAKAYRKDEGTILVTRSDVASAKHLHLTCSSIRDLSVLNLLPGLVEAGPIGSVLEYSTRLEAKQILAGGIAEDTEGGTFCRWAGLRSCKRSSSTGAIQESRE